MAHSKQGERLIGFLSRPENQATFEGLKRLWGAKPGTPEGDRLDVLATLIEVYEDEHYPIDASHPPDRDQVLAVLCAREPELRALGVERLTLFGSLVTGQMTASSDVDLAVVFAPDAPRGPERVDRLVDLHARLARLLARPVDVLEEPAHTASIREHIARHGVRVF
jgi:predicted nucleotidyltransferase